MPRALSEDADPLEREWARDPAPRTWPEVPFRPEVQDALAGRPAAITRVRARQPDVLLFIAEPIRHRGAVAGAVYAVRSTQPVLFELYRIRSGLLRVLAVALLFTGGVTLLLAWSISRPLGRLSRAARRVAAGEPDVEIPISGGGEIRELGEAFASMREQLGAPGLQVSEEGIPCHFAQVQGVGPQRRGPVVFRRIHDLSQLRFPIGQAGQHRGEEHRGGNAGLRHSPQRLQPPGRRRNVGFDLAGDAGIERGDAEADAHPRTPGQPLEDVDVTHDHRGARHQGDGCAGLAQDLEELPGDLVCGLGGLIGVGGRADLDLLPRPRWMGELAPQDLRGVDLDEDARAPAVDTVLV